MATSNVSTEFLCVECVGKKFGHSFRWQPWAGGAGACSSGDNASLPILGLCHYLRLEWKHGVKWPTSGSKNPTAEVIE